MPQNKNLMWFNKFWRNTVGLLSDQKIVLVNVINFRGCPVFFHKSRTHQYPDLLLSVSVNYHVVGAGDAYVTSESYFAKLHPNKQVLNSFILS